MQITVSHWQTGEERRKRAIRKNKKQKTRQLMRKWSFKGDIQKSHNLTSWYLKSFFCFLVCSYSKNQEVVERYLPFFRLIVDVFLVYSQRLSSKECSRRRRLRHESRWLWFSSKYLQKRYVRETNSRSSAHQVDGDRIIVWQSLHWKKWCVSSRRFSFILRLLWLFCWDVGETNCYRLSEWKIGSKFSKVVRKPISHQFVSDSSSFL